MNVENKHDIKLRMLNVASRLQGRKQDLGATEVDPLMDILMGACAQELETINHCIAESRERMFERMMEIMSPSEEMQGTQAYGIAQGYPSESFHFVDEFDQFTARHIESNKDIYFSPLNKYFLAQVKVNSIIFDGQLAQYNDKNELIVKANINTQPSHLQKIYIGLQVSKEVNNLKNLNIYLQINNLSNLNSNFLSHARVSVNQKELKIKKGLYCLSPSVEGKDLMKNIKKNEIEVAIQNKFFHFIDDILINEKDKSALPLELLNENNDAEKFTEPLYWFSIHLPINPLLTLDKLFCQANCFPIVNSKLNVKTEKISQDNHIISLETEDELFYSIVNVEGNNTYTQATNNFTDDGNGLYLLRNQGIARFDQRDAAQHLERLLVLLKEESASFKGMGYSNLHQEIYELDQSIRRINHNINLSVSSKNKDQYLYIKPAFGDQIITIKYITFNGSIANQLIVNQLKVLNNPNYLGNIFIIEAFRGGAEKPKPEDMISLFKKSVLSTNRVVTKQDIINYCEHFLGTKNIVKSEITDGVFIDENALCGISSSLNVNIFINKTHVEGLDSKRKDLEALLNENKTCSLPIFVNFKFS